MRKFTVIIVAFFVLFSCKTQQSGVSKKRKSSDSSERVYKNLYIEATTMAMTEDYEKAIELYEKCKALNPKKAAAYYELSRLYAKKRKAQLAFDNAEKALELKPKNKYYLLQKAQILNRTGQDEKAIKAFENLLKVDSKNIPVLYELTELYQTNEKYKEAAETIGKIESVVGQNPQMTYQKYLFLMDAGEVKPALDVIAELLKQDPENGMGNLALAQHYQKSGQEEKVFKRLLYVFEDPTIRTDTKLSIMMDYNKRVSTDEQSKKEALRLVDIMKRVHPNDVKSYVIGGDYYTNVGDLKLANENYEKALEFSDNAYPIFMQLLDNSYNLKEYGKLVDYANQAVESYPTLPVFYLYKGMGQREQKLYKKAITSFRSGNSMVIDNEKMSFDFYSKLGDTYHLLGDFKKSDESFEKAMEINGLEPYMLNNYSYYLSLRNDKLEKAASLSKKANDVYPNNPSFNDTYGWILFQQGKYEEAESWLKKSLNNGGDKSGTVLEHYGDVMNKLNKKDKALEYWKKAKETGEFSDELINKINKIK